MTAPPPPPKTFDRRRAEPRLQRKWRDCGVFACAATRGEAAASRPFTIALPPPNVTGVLHIGHALNHTLQDILCRFERLRGRDVLWQPGTDHAGIAAQMVVERRLESRNQSRRELGRDAFIEAVWDWRRESGDAIYAQMQRLGLSCDFDRSRFTMDEAYSRAVIHAFVRLHRDGLIYRDKRLVNWDPVHQTAISDLETVPREIDGSLWSIRYPLDDDESESIVVATTRPETMLGDSGVAVHPDDPRYRRLIGRFARLPLVGRRLPIVADPHADPETGSGAVKLTPAHDFNDFEIGRRHGLEMIDIFDERACLNDAVPPPWRGLDRYEARRRIVAALEDQGFLVGVVAHRHAVPHGDRSQAAIEPRLTDQWYVDAARLVAAPIAAVRRGEVRFYPDSWKKSYFEWMETIQPWCISRQIWWGHRIPAWHGPDGEIFVAEDESQAVAAARAHYGEERPLKRDEDVLDTWFSSALWPFATLGWPDETPELARHYPNDALVSGFDILFFWIARMMMFGHYFTGRSPFSSVYVHALVRDAEGRKMSKSKNNVIDPIDLVERCGADAVRFTLAAMAAQGRDIKLSEARVEGYRNFATKLWNAVRFAMMNGVWLETGKAAAAPPRHPVNRRIMAESAGAAAAVSAALEAYRFNDAAHVGYHFTWGSFCDWHLEFAKILLKSADADLREETAICLARTIERTLIVLHPMMPFVTEALWEIFSGQAESEDAQRAEALACRRWPQAEEAEAPDAEAEAAVAWTIACIAGLRSLRTTLNLAAGARPGLIAPAAWRESKTLQDAMAPLVERLGRVAVVDAQAPGRRIVMPVGAGTVEIALDADGFDPAAERARLGKQADALRRRCEETSQRLRDESFVQRAPADIVSAQRQRLDDAEAQLARLEDVRRQLAEA